MAIYPSHTRRQLEAGKIAIGMGLRLARTVHAAAGARVHGCLRFVPCNSVCGCVRLLVFVSALCVCARACACGAWVG